MIIVYQYVPIVVKKVDVTNICNKCNSVKYCNAACKKKHRSKHKKACERRVAELHDERLFKQPPQLEEDCPICFLRMPSISSVQMYMACCGKIICSGCYYAPVYDNQGNKVDGKKCPYCRTPPPTSIREVIKGYMKRMELNDTTAIYNLGAFYTEGQYGLPQNHAKALELYHQAAELGHSEAYYNIGNGYAFGEGVDVDKKKAIHYWELAAMGGVTEARHNLGVEEQEAGNVDRALKHYMIAVKGGLKISLENIQAFYMLGHVTKAEYTNALQVYQAYLDEIKSAQRDEAAAYNADWKYY